MKVIAAKICFLENMTACYRRGVDVDILLPDLNVEHGAEGGGGAGSVEREGAQPRQPGRVTVLVSGVTNSKN